MSKHYNMKSSDEKNYPTIQMEVRFQKNAGFYLSLTLGQTEGSFFTWGMHSPQKNLLLEPSMRNSQKKLQNYTEAAIAAIENKNTEMYLFFKDFMEKNNVEMA